MSKIDELIRELCPDGVEYKNLGILGRRNKGTPITASRMKELHQEGAPIKIFAGGKTVADFPAGAIPEKNIINEPSIIVKSRGHIGFEYYDKPFSHKNELWSYTIDANEVDQKYVYYYLLTKVKSLQELANATSVKLPQLSMKDTDSLRIPIPPHEVQREIVNILDKFTQLETELLAELLARQKQYEYYRTQLLTFDESRADVQKLTLKQVSKETFWIMPATPQFITDGEVPYITSKNIRGGHIDFTNIKHISKSSYSSVSKNRPIIEDDILVSMIGTIGEVARVKPSDLDFYGQNMYLLRLNQQVINVGYFLHFFDTAKMKKYFASVKNNSGQGYLKAGQVESIIIPVPPLDEQNRIVSVLDKFDRLNNDISEGLPAEINARRKQYEYYRTKLFTFQELQS